jgi:hypothetical protein
VTRFRLRFSVHELDLPLGESIVGRSSSAWITIDDPLISRRHARFVATEEGATIEDLGSRNGVRVNGRTVHGPVALADGDRIRLGSQQFTIRKAVEAEAGPRRATGFLVRCPTCQLACAKDAIVCAGCGSSLAEKDETTTTVHPAWSIELLLDTFRKAEGLGRPTDMERILAKIREEVDKSHELLQRHRLDQLADVAVRFSVEQRDLEWARWALSLFATHRVVPRRELGEHLGRLPAAERTTLAPAVDEVVRSLGPGPVADPIDRETLRTLSSVVGGPP